jgi:hypothetical protein
MASFAPGLVAWVTATALGLAPAVPLISRSQAPSVLVWPADGSPRGSETDADAVREAGFEPIAFEGIANAIEAAHGKALEAERARLDDVRAGLDRAQAEYLAQDWKGMLRELEALEQSSLALLATEPYCATLWELQFRRGLALHSRGDAELASDRFQFAAALDPTRRPASDLYGPDVAQAFLAAVEAHKADVAQPVTLDVEPSDAAIAIDCRSIATTTARVAAGLHVVRVEAPGHPAVAQVIDTRRDRSANVVAPRDTSLSPVDAIGRMPSGAALPLEGPTWSGAVEAAVEGVGADAYVWLAADDGRFAAQVVAEGKRGRRRVADGRAEAVALALDDLDAQGRVRMAKPVVAKTTDVRDGDQDRGKKDGVARKWWFWTILGTLAAGAIAVGLGVGLTRSDPERLRLFGPNR